MKRALCLMAALVLTAALAFSQAPYYARRIFPLNALPAACTPGNGEVIHLTTGATGLYQCVATNTWAAVGFTYTGAGGSQIFVGPGTAALPAIGFKTDATTGIYRAAAGTVGLTSAGTAMFAFAPGIISYDSSSSIRALANGRLNFVNAGNTDFTALTLGPEAVTNPRIAVSAAVAGQTQGIIILKGDGTAAAFADLGAATNGSMIYCSNCTVANPCAGAGTGALAKRLNGAWVCN